MERLEQTGEGQLTVPALRRAVAILDHLATCGEPVSPATLTKALGLPKSTAHGLILVLDELDLIARTPQGLLRLGPRSLRWSNAFLAQSDLVEEFRRHLAADESLSDHSVTLSVLDGTDVVYLACRNGAAPLGITFRIGMRLAAPFTATGKAMFSGMADADVRRILKGTWPDLLTPRSVASLDVFLAELEATRARGYSIDDGQVRLGMACVGAAVRDAQGQPVAGVALSFMEGEASPQTLDRLGGRLRGIAEALSRSLGWAG
ncbi:IclR family transcriptional regulator [Xaviernesmea oryzae]|uniref:IclR family transcriptional regulator n=1 Tax=Xaviernesmea oryzae TaxID=464029 RepID=A0A1Q9ATW3_9HYPH|nr:IclR family transcriptional regulator [Xaviernesmea oryzae]OLP58880.1 IclR family transcriptional regulator [Xaviernesmea oryzae]SEM03059.1 transcriptional regulator, IclR family [Xaviernesmea oryzae]